MDILVVDDEPLARQRLCRMLDKLDGYRVVGEAGDGTQAMTAIEQFDPDIVLLDVRMPGTDGIALAEQLHILEDPPAIIFCTAYDEYALDAFNVDAAGYLLKPVNQERLTQALNKAQSLNRVQLAAVARRESGQIRQTISAKSRRGIEMVNVDDVRAFLADHKYVTAHHVGGELLMDDTLKELESEMGDGFVRVHRNSLVSLRHILSMDKTPEGFYHLQLDGVEVRPVVSRRHVSYLKERLTHL